MLTYQDFERSDDPKSFISDLISSHESSEIVKMAHIADDYDAQRNRTINEYVQKIYTSSGLPVQNYIASNNKIASNFFQRLNTQRCTYSLGNGVTFSDEDTKKSLGENFDTRLKNAGYLALIHGVCFVFYNLDQIYVFPVTEFAPLYDENSGALRAGVRYWSIDADKPMTIELYEETGITKYRKNSNSAIAQIGEKRAYKTKMRQTAFDEQPEIIGEENYLGFPIVPLWGSRLHQSTLVGMQQSIDSFDLIRSGFANDLQDCAQIYWLLENYGGMDNAAIDQFRDRMLLQHIAVADTKDGGKIQAHTQEVPYASRTAYLQQIRAGIYEDFGGLDVSSISASSRTATEINAAYQPLDENADDFEYQIIECVQQILKLINIKDTPIFKRNRISNQYEQVQMVMLEAPYLDDETILSKLPNITPDEIPEIMDRKTNREQERFERTDEMTDDGASGDEA